jgi:Ribonucleotide reductase inhibitor
MVSSTKRRRFQAPITSFFTSRPPSPEALLNAKQEQEQQEPLLSPPLPDEIQSSLLTVGMRIRKSVPEGYKTQKTLHSARIYDQSKYPLGSGIRDYESTTDTTASSISRGDYAELAPLCGLHKIGGMALQPMLTAASELGPYRRNAEQAEALNPWSPPSSQESTYSDSPLPPSKKRNFTFDQDEDDEVEFGNDFLTQQPSSYPFSHTRMPSLDPFFPTPARSEQRAFAIPRSRFPSSRDWRLVMEGQENLGLTSRASNTLKSNPEIDFGEADFLESREDVDVDNMMHGC